jgi:hypothetical protein
LKRRLELLRELEEPTLILLREMTCLANAPVQFAHLERLGLQLEIDETFVELVHHLDQLRKPVLTLKTKTSEHANVRRRRRERTAGRKIHDSPPLTSLRPIEIGRP